MVPRSRAIFLLASLSTARQRVLACARGIAFVANHSAGRFVRSGLNQGLELGAVSGLAAGQFKCYGKAVIVCFQMNFRAEPAP